MHSNMLKPIHQKENQIIHILLKMVIVLMILLKELVKFILIKMFNHLVLPNSKLVLAQVQFLQQLKLIDMYSKDILEVLLPLLLVVPNLITVYSLLVMEPKMVKDISLSKTHGVLIGVLMVMSKSLIVHPTFVVS